MGNKVMIIAEAGVNHNGSMELAKKLIDVAVEAGADYVKFQTFKAEKIASNSAQKAEYQTRTTGSKEGQLQMLQRLELSYEDHLILIEYCNKKNIRFLSTPFDLDSIDLLKGLGINIGKIPSGEITNLPYLKKMAASFNELILSTGMADTNEIKQAVEVILNSGFPKEKLIILHCTTEYPTPFNEVNLFAMNTIASTFGTKVGYSDHTRGIEVPIAAVAIGAQLIEKHFTLDKNMEGPDHKASLEPVELKAMISAIRNIEVAITGSAIKEPTESELKNIKVVRKSIVAIKPINKGEIFTVENIGVKRPGTGISPMKWETILGAVAVKDFNEDDLIEL